MTALTHDYSDPERAHAIVGDATASSTVSDRRRASLYVAAHATDAEDCAVLLQALGPLPYAVAKRDPKKRRRP